MGPSSPMQSTPRSRATLGSTSDWKISFNPVVKRWGIQEIQRIQKILFSNLKITNFEWNLVFQPPKIAGSMLIYINLLEGILYTVILNISWNWQWRKELADDLLWPLILSIVAVGSRLMEHLGGSIQTQTCHLFFSWNWDTPKTNGWSRLIIIFPEMAVWQGKNTCLDKRPILFLFIRSAIYFSTWFHQVVRSILTPGAQVGLVGGVFVSGIPWANHGPCPNLGYEAITLW